MPAAWPRASPSPADPCGPGPFHKGKLTGGSLEQQGERGQVSAEAPASSSRTGCCGQGGPGLPLKPPSTQTPTGRDAPWALFSPFEQLEAICSRNALARLASLWSPCSPVSTPDPACERGPCKPTVQRLVTIYKLGHRHHLIRTNARSLSSHKPI